MKISVKIYSPLIIIMVIILFISTGMCDKEDNESSNTLNISSNSPAGGLLYNGTVDTPDTIKVTTASGVTYSVPGNSPAGVLEILRSESKIKNYSLGDELMNKRGILILNGINGLYANQDTGWFEKVNGERLEDVVLADAMGINKVTLNEGDVILYVLGDPRGIISESVARLAVTIGKSIGETENKIESKEENVTNESEKTNITETEELEDRIDSNITNSGSTGKNKDSESQSNTSAGEKVLYSGSFSLPSGDVNVTTSGADYEIMAATPLGLLQSLLTDEKISSVTVSDRAMKKAGILILEGINDIQFSGEKTWFVIVNGVILKDYLNPHTEGLNIYKIKSGDKVGFYYGEPSKPVGEAETSMIITIK